MLAGHGAAALACPRCSTLLKGGCAQRADQCRADGDCCHAASSSVGGRAEEPWSAWDLALAQKWVCVSKSGPLCPGAPASLHSIFCERSSAFTDAMWQNVCMETASFRNSAESLLSQVLVHLIVSAGSFQLFLLRGLSVCPYLVPREVKSKA